MKTMSEYFEYKAEESVGNVVYFALLAGKCVVSELLMKGFEQLSIPIEAAMSEEEPPYGDVS